MWGGGADFLHLAWSCPGELEYWRRVEGSLSAMIAAPLTLTPLIALLGYTEEIGPVQRRYLGFALLLAKRRVACRWGRGRAPKFKNWLSDLVCGKMQLEAYAELLPPTSRPRDIWAPLDTYLLGRLDPIDNGVSAGSPLEEWAAGREGTGDGR
ncbi:hypothetical protein NDU88_005168 [Pleurodeles waltl]|uniref:Uncharacterized protein n=1 Tax=Pleurodeles waltl TaxID=8319 RepID=A0AAV7WWB4_PLEWA|nr:hypothetical protein NDU88_005168 [Pleurodeles waltl]